MQRCELDRSSESIAVPTQGIWRASPWEARLCHGAKRECSRRLAYTHYSRRLAGEATGAFSMAESLAAVATTIGLGT